MRPGRSRSWKLHTSALALAVLAAGVTIDLSAQPRGFARGGGTMSTSRVISPAVVASWMSHDNSADGSKTTLLVLWRGTTGWFSKGGRGGQGGRAGWSSGGSSGAGGSGSRGYQFVSEGGLTFTLEFDYDRRIVKILDREISLKETNVVLVDFVDSASGPAIVGDRWIEPGAGAPPIVPDAASDPVAGIVGRAPELFEYLRCGERLPPPAVPAMNEMLAFLCARMRPN